MTANEPGPRLVLASASPARLRTLQAAGIDAEVIVSGIDESTVDSTRPDEVSGLLARLKAQAVAAQVPAGSRVSERSGAASSGLRSAATREDNVSGRRGATGPERTLVLGCDSVLAFDGAVFGKPSDAGEAATRWRHMRGRAGVLYTGHCLIDAVDGRRAEAVAATTVHFAHLDDAEIEAYVATGEPLQVAGAFTIDGLGGPFVERIEGDPGTVIGLSLPVLRHLLRDLGVQITALWRRS